MEFKFGSAVSATKIVDSSQHAYQNAFYNNFEWAVLENAEKWRQMESTRGQIDYDRPLHAIDALRSHGIKVRCHCAFWDKEEFTQDWVKQLHGDSLRTAITERIQGVISHTKGKCEQWDVNNELLHGHVYELQTGDPDITHSMFRQIHAIDGHPRLFLNDYELGINEQDDAHRATRLVDTLTMMFSHPSVEGVIFWGFWDGQIWEKDAVLYTGSNVTPNAAGRAYEELFHTTWRTHVTSTIHGSTPFHVRGFKGEYELKVKHNGHVLQTETFTLAEAGKTLQIHLNGGTPDISHVIIG
ncbi:RSGI6-like protein [Mya arenaria]|uniref:RSGI6-like protein n=1 Tax=Mya arenaria TaxID=6604 RepID=A0ABY7ET18_MYAAR|nr:RSGI6-like protein [Mya arenaria]